MQINVTNRNTTELATQSIVSFEKLTLSALLKLFRIFCGIRIAFTV
jgi:hypothetical protein